MFIFPVLNTHIPQLLQARSIRMATVQIPPRKHKNTLSFLHAFSSNLYQQTDYRLNTSGMTYFYESL